MKVRQPFVSDERVTIVRLPKKNVIRLRIEQLCPDVKVDGSDRQTIKTGKQLKLRIRGPS